MNYRDFLMQCVLDAYDRGQLPQYDAITLLLVLRGALPFNAVGL